MFCVYLDCKRIWQFDSYNATKYKDWITAKYFVVIGATDSYSINGETNNKIALKRGSFEYYILNVIIMLGRGSLLYQTWGFNVCIVYIFMYV